MTKRAFFSPLIWILLLASPSLATAQQPAANGAQLVDRVVAVVGDSAILLSELEEELQMRFAGRQLPERDERERVRRELLDTKVNQLILIHAAERDSIFASAEDVDRYAEQEITERRRAFGGEREFEQALQLNGLTLVEYREIVTSTIRRQMVVEQYIGMIRQTRRPPPVTEEAIRAFFEAQSNALEPQPALVSFRQVVLSPKPSDSVRAALRDEGIDLIERLRGGEDFAQLARRFSADPGTRDRGGDLGWFRRGDMLPAFERAVFALQPGTIGLAESAEGFHVIRVERARGGERQARHILLRPQITDDDLERTRELAEDLVERVRSGESIDQLAREHGDPEEEVRVGPFPRNELPPAYAAALADAEPGTLIGPFSYSPPGRREQWVVLRVIEMVDERTPTLEELRDQIRQILEDELMMEELVGDLHKRTYVDVRY